MQTNPTAAANGNPKTRKTTLIIALICIPFAGMFVVFIVFAAMFFMGMNSLPYMARTAKAQSEIIKITPTTWTESRSTGSSKSPTVSTQVSGYSVSYKFTTADGQVIFQTDTRQRTSAPSRLTQVCYEPQKPTNSGLQSEGKCP